MIKTVVRSGLLPLPRAPGSGSWSGSSARAVLDLRSRAATAAARGVLDPAEARAFEEQFDEAIRIGRFTWAVTFFLTAGMVALPD